MNHRQASLKAAGDLEMELTILRDRLWTAMNERFPLCVVPDPALRAKARKECQVIKEMDGTLTELFFHQALTPRTMNPGKICKHWNDFVAVFERLHPGITIQERLVSGTAYVKDRLPSGVSISHPWKHVDEYPILFYRICRDLLDGWAEECEYLHSENSREEEK